MMNFDVTILTIGVYGFTETTFFRALAKARVDTFCDVRSRRGMRGAKYAFVNSRYLQQRLQEMGIRYLHLKDLAPTPEIRQLQKQVDKRSRTAKRKRQMLSPEFTKVYQEQILEKYDWEEFLSQIPKEAHVVALFCVEGEPAACHRSLIASHLCKLYNANVQHITP